MTPDLGISREIAAPAADVYAAITDITRMGEWSPECVAAEWSDGFDGPVVGAMFVGHNENGEKRWSIESKIVELEQDRRFFFDCISHVTPGYVFAKWGYAIEPTETGCVVTEFWQDLRPDFMMERSAVTSGVQDRLAHNRSGMAATLDRLAAAVEHG